MRVISSIFASILLAAAVASLIVISTVFAQSSGNKTICLPIVIDNVSVNPNIIPIALLNSMTNRGQGSYSIGISLCSSSPAAAEAVGCSGSGFVGIGNSTGSCIASFNQPLMRPTPTNGGFAVKYGSDNAQFKNDHFQATVLCNPFSNDDSLQSRSNKFAAMTPNKVGGTTYMVVLYSHAACGGNHTHETTTAAPPGPPEPTGAPSSVIPSNSGSMSNSGSYNPGSSSMSGGGSSMSSDMPSSGSMSYSGGSGGSFPNIPSGESMSMGSGSGGFFPPA